MQDKFEKGGEIFNVYQKIFKFHKQHAAASTDADWDAIAASLNDFAPGLESDLVVAAVTDIERYALGETSNPVVCVEIQKCTSGRIYVQDNKTGISVLATKEEALKILGF